MLTPNQQKYLLTIPEDKRAKINSFDPKVKETAEFLVQQIKSKLPDLEIFYGGASALGIAGQNDIDLNLLSVPEEYEKYLPSLIELFGQPAKSRPTLIKWKFEKNGFDVELYLTDRSSLALQEQIKTFKLLRDNPTYLKDYEQIKLSSDGLAFREYIRRKYEFFNRILKE